MSAIFLMDVKKRTKIELGKKIKFEIAITRSSFSYMARFSVFS